MIKYALLGIRCQSLVIPYEANYILSYKLSTGKETFAPENAPEGVHSHTSAPSTLKASVFPYLPTHIVTYSTRTCICSPDMDLSYLKEFCSQTFRLIFEHVIVNAR